MEAESGSAAASLSRLLFERPCEFELFQVVRLLQRVNPQRNRVGGFELPDTEAVRFYTDGSLACPASLVRGLEQAGEGASPAPARLTIAGFQLTGYCGVLPYFYSRLLDGPARAFLDAFVHRLASLQYRAWEKHRLHLAIENGEASATSTSRVLALLGASASESGLGRANRLTVQYASVRLGAAHSSIGLQQVIEDTCGVKASVEQFRLTQVVIAEDDRARIGTGRSRHHLGDRLLGKLMWQGTSAFRIVLGPLSNADYERLLPGGAEFRDLVALVRRFIGPASSDFDVELRLKRAEAAPARISAPRDSARCEETQSVPSIPTRLGRYGWLGSATDGPRSSLEAGQDVSGGGGYHSGVFRWDDPAAQRRLGIESEIRALKGRLAATAGVVVDAECAADWLMAAVRRPSCSTVESGLSTGSLSIARRLIGQHVEPMVEMAIAAWIGRTGLKPATVTVTWDRGECRVQVS